MAYIPDPTNLSQPTSDVKASTAADEFRALKNYIATLLGGLPGEISVKSLNGGQLAGLRNKIINGGMEIAQRGVTFAAVGSGAYTLDRWVIQSGATAGVLTASQSTDVPADNEFQASLKLEVTTADAAVGASDLFAVQQMLEGYNARDLIGRPITISFRVRSAKTGVHCIALRNGAQDRSYVMEYTVNAANTWESKSVTVPAGLITAGTWDWAAGIGLRVSWVLMTGSTYQTVANAWQAGTYLATAAQVNVLDTVGNVFAITGIQLEVGTQATPFEHRPYGLESLLCLRYYQSFGGVVNNFGVAGYAAAGTNIGYYHAWTVPMRAAPSVTVPVMTNTNTTGIAANNPNALGTLFLAAATALGTVSSYNTGGGTGAANAEL